MTTLTPSSEDVNIYELTVLLPYALNQKEQQDLVKEVEGIFDEAGAKILEKDVWDRRGLAYPIKGHMEGIFIAYYLEIDPAKVKEIDHALKITKGVLRFLYVKPPKNFQIVKYSQRFEQWQKEEKDAEEAAAQRKEDELKRKVLEKAKIQNKRTEKKAPATVGAPKKTEKKEISSEIDKLISDDDLSI